jgi:citrate lyase subunit beta/citryl-CoA lyase
MFVPGNKERFLEKAPGSGADAILLDLEDGVLPDEKATARLMVARALETPWDGPLRYVRVNALATPWLFDDLNDIVQNGLDGICLTKVDNADQIAQVDAILSFLEHKRDLPKGGIRILAAIESARGLNNAVAIAACNDRVAGLMFGAEDYALDLGLGARRQKEAAELIYSRSMIVGAAAAAGVWSVDGVYPNLEDPQGLIDDTKQARRLGFTAKSTFNPRQIEVINGIFSPQPDEIEYARKIAKAFEEAERRGDASVAVGGQLVDRPILLRALAMLETQNAEART